MMKKEAKQYSAEEKTKIALEALRGELTYAQITSKYGVHSTQINSWKKLALESMVTGFKDKRKGKDPGGDNLVSELYQQIGQLTVVSFDLRGSMGRPRMAKRVNQKNCSSTACRSA